MATELAIRNPYSNLELVWPLDVNFIERHLSSNPPPPDQPIFEETFIIKSLQEWDEKKAAEYEHGNRIIAPDSELKRIVLSNNTETELILQMFNPNLPQKISHCSVLEWTAPNGIIYIPSWMITDFCLQNVSNQEPKLTLRYYEKPFLKGSIIQIQPYKLASIHSDEFKDVQHLFEKSLKKYQCLTIGDTLRIKHNNNIHSFEVTDVLSAQSIGSITPFDVVSIINTDVCVDFLPPKDAPIDETKESRIDGYDVDINNNNNIDNVSAFNPSNQYNEIKENDSFTGIGHTLNDNVANAMTDMELLANVEAKRIVCDENQNTTRIQIIFIDNRTETLNVNLTTTIEQIYAHCKLVSGYNQVFQLLAGYPPQPLLDPNATVQEANLTGIQIRQRVF